MALVFIAALIGGIQGGGVDNSVAWRYAMAVPTAMLVLLAVPMLFLSDDCPQGAWKDRLYNKKKENDGPKETFGDSLKGMVKRTAKDTGKAVGKKVLEAHVPKDQEKKE